VNGGLHAHGTLTIPEFSRFNGDVRLHIAENQAHYVKNRPGLSRIDIGSIKSQPEYVVDYVLKAFKCGRINPDHAAHLCWIYAFPYVSAAFGPRYR
jgi:hypothetical protein